MLLCGRVSVVFPLRLDVPSLYLRQPSGHVSPVHLRKNNDDAGSASAFRQSSGGSVCGVSLRVLRLDVGVRGDASQATTFGVVAVQVIHHCTYGREIGQKRMLTIRLIAGETCLAFVVVV